MERIKLKEKITIERNFIERTLMSFKGFFQKNKKQFVYSFLFLGIAIAVGIASLVYVNYRLDKNRVKFEQLTENYKQYYKDKDNEKAKETIETLKELVDSSYFGFLNKMGNYLIGNMLYAIKDYKEAYNFLLKYAEQSSSSTFKPLAYLKAALSAEENNDLEGALKIYKTLEDNYIDSLVADQIYYNLGRIYQQKKDLQQAKNYFDKVISLFAQSPLADQAKERIFLLNWENK